MLDEPEFRQVIETGRNHSLAYYLKQAREVQIRLNGRNYYQDVSLSEKEIEKLTAFHANSFIYKSRNKKRP